MLLSLDWIAEMLAVEKSLAESSAMMNQSLCSPEGGHVDALVNEWEAPEGPGHLCPSSCLGHTGHSFSIKAQHWDNIKSNACEVIVCFSPLSLGLRISGRKNKDRWLGWWIFYLVM